MPDYELKEDLLAPEYIKAIKFEGSNLTKVIGMIPTLIKDVFKIEAPSTFNDSLKWDDSGNNYDFYVQWRGKEGLDARTTLWITVIAQGSQNKETKNGNLTIYITGKIKTKFPYHTALDKLIVTIYTETFYKDKRRLYIQEGVKKLKMLEDRFRAEFNLVKRADV